MSSLPVVALASDPPWLSPSLLPFFSLPGTSTPMPLTTPSSLRNRSNSSLSRPSPSFLAFLGALPGLGKTHSICARLQLLHGCVLSHLTFLLLQVTQLRGFNVRPCESTCSFEGADGAVSVPFAVDSSCSGGKAFSEDSGRCVKNSEGAEGAVFVASSLPGVCFWPSEDGVLSVIWNIWLERWSLTSSFLHAYQIEIILDCGSASESQLHTTTADIRIAR
jgi:hypothetical protein